jgi:heme/copper-type cytochrome/quinol oxidase subunit 2
VENILLWIVFGAIVIAVAVVTFLIVRSLNRWSAPPPDPNTEEARKLLWLTFSRGDESK